MWRAGGVGEQPLGEKVPEESGEAPVEVGVKGARGRGHGGGVRGGGEAAVLQDVAVAERREPGGDGAGDFRARPAGEEGGTGGAEVVQLPLPGVDGALAGGNLFLPLLHERDDGLGGGGGKGLLDVVVQAAAGGLAALVGEDGGDELVPKEVAEEVIDLVQDGGAGRAEGAANAPAPS